MKKTKLLATASMMAFLSACSVSTEPLTLESSLETARADLAKMFDDNEPINGELSLSDAIARALMYNLDHRAKAMEQALAVSDADLSKFELLPTLTANAGYDYRSAHNATNSATVGSNTAPGAYTYSADKNSVTGDLTMGWNVLDFGVSYFNAKQNSDRALIAEERRRKVIHNLVKEVQRSYWRMVAAQKLEDKVQVAVTNAKRALAQAEKVESERLRAPEDALLYQKRLLENLRQLEAINRELASARFELAALINVAPTANVRVQVPENDTLEIPAWEASVEDMVQLAFYNNPDLREKMYLSRISVQETKKTMLSMLPGVNLSLGRNYDDNQYLDQNRWYEFSSSLSWNLFNILKLPARQKYAENNERLAEVQRLALRMALMAQVHVAKHQYSTSVSKFKQQEKMYNVDQRLTFHMTKRQNNSSQGVLNRISQETAAITSELMRYQAYAEVMGSIGQIHSTLGIGIVPEGTTATDVNGLSQSISTAMGQWRSGRAIEAEVAKFIKNGEAEAATAAVTTEQPATPVEKVVTETKTQPETAAEKAVTAAKTPTASTTTTAPAPLKSKASFVSLTLNDGPGEAPVYNVRLSCNSLKVDNRKNGWAEVSAKDTKGNNRNGWIHDIYLIQAKLKCEAAG